MPTIKQVVDVIRRNDHPLQDFIKRGLVKVEDVTWHEIVDGSRRWSATLSNGWMLWGWAPVKH